MSDNVSEQGPTGPTMIVGQVLKAARERLDYSQDDVAQKTRVPLRFIDAIETGNYGVMPKGMYAVGFVKTYAKYVELDPASIGEQFRTEIGYAREHWATPEYMEEADPSRVPPKWFVLAALIAAILLVLGYIAISRGFGTSDDEVSQIAAGTVPDDTGDVAAAGDGQPVAAAVPAAPAAAASGPVMLTATDAVWLRVYERSGGRLFEKEMVKGESWQVPTTAVDPLILTGRPQAVQVKIGASVMPPLGQPDLTIKDVSLKPDALRAMAAAAPLVGTAPVAAPTAAPTAQ
jgi:transcriptional regulator with XRE-family HTH domain